MRRASSKGQAFDFIAASRRADIGGFLILAQTQRLRAPVLLPGGAQVNILRRNRMAQEAPVSNNTPSLTPQDALVAVMIAVSASDENIRTAELVAIQRIVNHLPVFADYDADRLRRISQTVFDLFEV